MLLELAEPLELVVLLASPVVQAVMVAPVVQEEERPLQVELVSPPVERQVLRRYSATNCWTTPRHCCGFLLSIDRKLLVLFSLPPWLPIRLSSLAAWSNRPRWQVAPLVRVLPQEQEVLPA